MSHKTCCRQVLASVVCLALICAVCLNVVGCGPKTVDGEDDMPEKAKTKAAQMREEGMKAGNPQGARKGRPPGAPGG